MDAFYERQDKINFYEAQFFASVSATDAATTALVRAGKTAEAVEAATAYSVDTGEQMTKDWRYAFVLGCTVFCVFV